MLWETTTSYVFKLLLFLFQRWNGEFCQNRCDSGSYTYILLLCHVNFNLVVDLEALVFAPAICTAFKYNTAMWLAEKFCVALGGLKWMRDKMDFHVFLKWKNKRLDKLRLFLQAMPKISAWLHIKTEYVKEIETYISPV